MACLVAFAFSIICYLWLQSWYCYTWRLWTCLGPWLPTFRRYWYATSFSDHIL